EPRLALGTILTFGLWYSVNYSCESWRHPDRPASIWHKKGERE
ncbi:unnamed protein product, partial [Caretta caretta]